MLVDPIKLWKSLYIVSDMGHIYSSTENKFFLVAYVQCEYSMVVGFPTEFHSEQNSQNREETISAIIRN